MTPRLSPPPLVRLWRRYRRVGMYLLLLAPPALLPSAALLTIPMAVCGGLTGNPWIGAVGGLLWDSAADRPFGFHGLLLWLAALLCRRSPRATLPRAWWMTGLTAVIVAGADGLWGSFLGTFPLTHALKTVVAALLSLPVIYGLFRQTERWLQRREAP